MPITGKRQEQPLFLFFFFLFADEKPIERFHRLPSAPNLGVSFTVTSETHLSFFSRSDEKTHLTASCLPHHQWPSMVVRHPLPTVHAWIFSGRKPISVATVTATTCCRRLPHCRPAKPIITARLCFRSQPPAASTCQRRVHLHDRSASPFASFHAAVCSLRSGEKPITVFLHHLLQIRWENLSPSLAEETHLLAANLHAPMLQPDLDDHQSSKISAQIRPIFLLSRAHQIYCSPYDQRSHGLRVVNRERNGLREAVHQTVNVIFEDPGVQELLVKLYQKEWLEGLVTEYLVATFGDYFTDVKMYIEDRSFRRFVEACLEETVVIYVDHLLTQRNYIKEETIERMRLDEEVIVDFFREYINVTVSAALLEYSTKVENRVRVLSDLRELASAESLDTFTLVYTNILEVHPDCPPEVVEKLVALREGIPRKDAKEAIESACRLKVVVGVIQQWLLKENVMEHSVRDSAEHGRSSSKAVSIGLWACFSLQSSV
ncbi:hypothetical protein ACLOJK_016111 [Asimina triloba]